MPHSHDQSYKNLILDYPHQALAFFARAEAHDLDRGVRITPIREEQLKNRLGDRFRELDVPLLVEWPDGRREALLFVLEEETDPRRFSIHRLVHYCTDLAELYGTSRVVPVVIFLDSHDNLPDSLILGSERYRYLMFHYLKCDLSRLDAEHYLDSDNLAARLNLPHMRWAPERKVEVYARAVDGLLTLEADPDKQLKYLDFIDIYLPLDDNEMHQYQQHYLPETPRMLKWSERLELKGKEAGLQEGRQEGEVLMLTRQLERRFGPLDDSVLQRLRQADTGQLECWGDNILDARNLDEVFAHG